MPEVEVELDDKSEFKADTELIKPACFRTGLARFGASRTFRFNAQYDIGTFGCAVQVMARKWWRP